MHDTMYSLDQCYHFEQIKHSFLLLHTNTTCNVEVRRNEIEIRKIFEVKTSQLRNIFVETLICVRYCPVFYILDSHIPKKLKTSESVLALRNEINNNDNNNHHDDDDDDDSSNKRVRDH